MPPRSQLKSKGWSFLGLFRRRVGLALLIGMVDLGLPTASLAAEAPPRRVDVPPSGYRLHPLEPGSPSEVEAGFRWRAPEETGVVFTNRLAVERSLTNHVLLNGSGVALGDVDADGRCDIFLAGLGGGSAFFRNLGGWRFAKATAESFGSSTAFEGMEATGAVLADLEGDGDLDLLLNSIGGGTRCWRNDGTGRFKEVTAEVGLVGRSGASSMALADVDGDGDLDLYQVNYRTSTVRDEFQQRFEIRMVGSRPTVVSVNGRSATEPGLIGRFSVDAEGRVTEHGEADSLYLNRGDGRFEAVPFTSGRFLDESGQPLKAPLYDWGLAAQFRDLDGDLAPDLYVCNDLGSPDRIWLNDGKGGFRALPRTHLRKTSFFSMGVDFGDLNRDGLDDFFVTDMLSRDPVQRQVEAAPRTADAEPFSGIEARPQTARNTLFAGRGGTWYSEIAWWAGIEASDWSWSPVFLDVDLDGLEDILLSTGFERNVQDADVADEIEAIRIREKLTDAQALQLRRRFPSLAQPNLAYRNQGGFRFEEVGKTWGFDQVGVSQGMALADLDQDGDLDVVVNNLNSGAFLLENQATAPRLQVRLRGRSPNTQGIGAQITVHGGPVLQRQEIASGGRYASGDDPVRVFASGSSGARLRLEVRWRSGRLSVVSNLPPSGMVEVLEPDSASVQPATSPPTPLFVPVRTGVVHRHRDPVFDDLSKPSLLPRSLANLGPAACWGDLNGDGWDDLVIGSGRSGRIAGFLNDGRGNFVPDGRPLFERPTPLDQLGILIQPKPSGAPDLLVAFSNYEAPKASGGVRILDLQSGGVRPGGIPLGAVPGPLAMADVDGDGFLELFVGGRAIPGKYPDPAPSGLFRQTPHGWVATDADSPMWRRLGLVTGATFSDIDSDGDPDLMVATEWGPLHCLRNDRGRWTDWDVPVRWEETGVTNRLSQATGWWQGLCPVDLDGDGRLDLVAANWGRNHRYTRGAVRLFSGDFDGNETLEWVETVQESSDADEMPQTSWRRLTESWPSLLERFPTRRQFGRARFSDLLGTAAASARVSEARVLDSMVFLNRGDHFTARPLPPEAQWSPAFGVAAADFDGDGFQDVVLAQNFSGSQPETDRDDAGLGLFLRGDGKGGLVPWSPMESGLSIPGEQRAVAVADFDQDGRSDLVLTQNRELTQILRNEGGRRGLRVRIRGDSNTLSGIGSQVRLVFQGTRMGPVQEIRAGSGYLSQDSPVIVMATPEMPTGVWIRRPGKAPRIQTIEPAATELVIDP